MMLIIASTFVFQTFANEVADESDWYRPIFVLYNVQSGDTYDILHKRYGFTKEDIEKYNDISISSDDAPISAKRIAIPSWHLFRAVPTGIKSNTNVPSAIVYTPGHPEYLNFIKDPGSINRLGNSLYQSGVTLAKSGKTESALKKFEQAHTYNSGEATYQLGHYYLFGEFDFSNGGFNYENKYPIDLQKGLAYMNKVPKLYLSAIMGIPQTTLFVDPSSWLRSPDRAIYYGYREKEYIEQVCQLYTTYPLNFEKMFVNGIEESINEMKLPGSTGNGDYAQTFMLQYYMYDLDDIINCLEYIPHNTTAYSFNKLDWSTADLMLEGTRLYNTKEYIRALYFFKRAEMTGNDEAYRMRIQTMSEILDDAFGGDVYRDYDVACAMSAYANVDSDDADYNKPYRKELSNKYNKYKRTCLKACEKKEKEKQRQAELAAKREREQNRRNDYNFGMALLNVLCQGVNSYMNMHAYRMPTYASPSHLSANMTNSQFTAAVNNDLQNIMAQSIQQVQAQEWNEYLQFSSYNRKPSGDNYSYTEWMCMKGQAIMDSNSSNLSSGNSTAYSSATSQQTSAYSSQRQCVYCNGTGKIIKYISTPTFGLSETKKKCTDCGEYYYPSNGHAHVHCSHCGGTGIAK